MPREEDLLDAVDRKIEIARFHLARLKHELAVAIRADEYIAPIAVQAYLEGVVAAADAAADKAARLKRRMQAVTMPDGRSAQEHFVEWRSQSLIQHVQCLRDLALHSAYFKRPLDYTWSVPVFDKADYQGPRELEPYCEAVVISLDALERILAYV